MASSSKAPPESADEQTVSPLKRSKWTDEEKVTLIRLVEQDDRDISWKEVSKHFPNRSEEACMEYYKRNLRKALGPLKLRAWTSQEEEKLAELHRRKFSWDDIADELPGRSADACKTHFYGNVDKEPKEPVMSTENWTAEEDEKIIRFIRSREKELSWAKVAEDIPGRTALGCKARWHRTLRHRYEQGLDEGVSRLLDVVDED